MDQTTGVINPDAVNYNTNANFPGPNKYDVNLPTCVYN